jgi:hypothetical protein
LIASPAFILMKGCHGGYTVHYARVPRLSADLDLAQGDGLFARLFPDATHLMC